MQVVQARMTVAELRRPIVRTAIQLLRRIHVSFDETSCEGPRRSPEAVSCLVGTRPTRESDAGGYRIGSTRTAKPRTRSLSFVGDCESGDSAKAACEQRPASSRTEFLELLRKAGGGRFSSRPSDLRRCPASRSGTSRKGVRHRIAQVPHQGQWVASRALIRTAAPMARAKGSRRRLCLRRIRMATRSAVWITVRARKRCTLSSIVEPR